MTTTELEAVIREIMKNIYKADYIGKLMVVKEPKGFLIKLGIPTPETPIILYSELEGEQLIKFLEKDLRDRNISPNFFGSIQLTYPVGCNNVNRKCCDTR